MSQVDSLFNDLTRIDGQFPATTSIVSLVHTLAQNACESKRYTQTLCHLASRGRDVCNEIHVKIRVFKETRDWEIFGVYTKMIEELEDLLYDTAVVVKDEQTHLNPNPDGGGEYDLVNLTSVTLWNQNRSLFNKLLRDLYTGSFAEVENTLGEPWEATLALVLRHDDMVWLSALCGRLQEIQHPQPDRKNVVEHMQDLLSALHRRPTQGETEDEVNSRLLSLRCGTRVFSIVQPQDGAVSNVGQLNELLKKPKTWKDADSIIARLLSYIVTPKSSKELQRIQEDWDKFEKALLLCVGLGKKLNKPRDTVLLSDEHILDVKAAGLSDNGAASSSTQEPDPETPPTLDSISFAYLGPGYLLYHQKQAPTTIRLRNLKDREFDPAHNSLLLSSPSPPMAVDDSGKLFAFATNSQNAKDSLSTSTIPPNDQALPTLVTELKIPHVFWIGSSELGFIGGENPDQVIYHCPIISNSPDQPPQIGDYKLLFPLHGALQPKSRLYHSVLSHGDDKWLAINILKGPTTRCVQCWSSKDQSSVVLEGVGTIATISLEGRSRNIIVTARRKEETIIVSAYELDNRPISQPYQFLVKEDIARDVPGEPTFVHVFESLGVALVVVASEASASPILYDLHTGQSLQTIKSHVMWMGTFCREWQSPSGALLVADPSANVHRVTVNENLLAYLRQEWTSKKSK